MQRRQQGGDEASAKSDGRAFRTIQIFVKVDGSKAFPLEVSLSDKVGDVLKRTPSIACAHLNRCINYGVSGMRLVRNSTTGLVANFVGFFSQGCFH